MTVAKILLSIACGAALIGFSAASALAETRAGCKERETGTR